MITIGHDIPESIEFDAIDLDKLRELIKWEATIPSVFRHGFVDRIYEAVSEQQYELLDNNETITQLRAMENTDFNIVRFFTKEDNRVFLDVYVETEDGEADFEVELIAA